MNVTYRFREKIELADFAMGVYEFGGNITGVRWVFLDTVDVDIYFQTETYHQAWLKFRGRAAERIS